MALFSPEALNSDSLSPLAERLRQITVWTRRRASIWCFLYPAEGLSREDAGELLSSLAPDNANDPLTTIVATDRSDGLEAYDRILHVENGRIVGGGS